MIEKEPLIVSEAEKIPVRKLPEIKKIPPGLEGWLEKIEKEVYLGKPVIDDQTGQVLVTSPAAKKPKIVLPLTRQQLVSGLNQKVSQAIRWLAEWCLRIIKIKSKEVKLKEEKDD